MKKFKNKVDEGIIKKVVAHYRETNPELTVIKMECKIFRDFLNQLTCLQDNDDYYQLIVGREETKEPDKTNLETNVLDYRIAVYLGDDTISGITPSAPASLTTEDILIQFCKDLETTNDVSVSQSFQALASLLGNEEKQNSSFLFIQKSISSIIASACIEQEYKVTKYKSYDETCKLSIKETKPSYWTAYIYAPKGNGIAGTMKISTLTIHFFIEDLCELLEKMNQFPQLIDLSLNIEKGIGRFFANIKANHLQQFEQNNFIIPKEVFEVFDAE